MRRVQQLLAVVLPCLLLACGSGGNSAAPAASPPGSSSGAGDETPAPGIDHCDAAGRYGDGVCDACPRHDWDCDGAGDDCMADGRFADGACDACERFDPDCDSTGEVDLCMEAGRYGDGTCDACPHFDPDCEGMGGETDPCSSGNRYGDGVCDACPSFDMDCDHGVHSLPVVGDLSAGDGTLPARIELAWRPVTGAERYVIERSRSPFDGFAPHSEVTEPKFVDLEVDPGVVYYYRLEAQGLGVASRGFTEPEVGFAGNLETSVGRPESPAAPAALLVTKGDGASSVRLQWALDLEVGAWSLYRQRGYDDDAEWVQLDELFVQPGWRGPWFEDHDVAAGDRVRYALGAQNGAGESERSAAATVYVPGAPPAPITFRATYDAGTVTLDWTVRGTGGAVAPIGFRIFRSNGAGEVEKVGQATAAERSFVDTEAPYGANLVYELRAFNQFGESAAAPTAAVTTGRPVAALTRDSGAAIPSGATLELGSLGVGFDAPIALQLRNFGDLPLYAGGDGGAAIGLEGSAAYSLHDAPQAAVLQPGDVVDFVLRYAPTAAGDHVATLTLKSDDPQTPNYTVAIAARALSTTPALTIEGDGAFGTIRAGEETRRAVTLTSAGDGPVEVSGLTLGDGPFTLIHGATDATGEAWRILPGESLELELVAAATAAAGVYETSLQIASNDPAEPARTLDISAVVATAPAAPAGLVSIDLGDGSFELRWADLATDELGYELRWGSGVREDAMVVDLPADATSHVVTAAEAGLRYTAWLHAVGSSFHSAERTLSITLRPNTPEWEFALPVEGDWHRSVGLSWRGVAGVERYHLYRSQGDERPSEPFATSLRNQETITELAEGTAYTFWIGAVNDGGESISEPISVTTWLQAPELAEASFSEVTSTSVRVHWVDRSALNDRTLVQYRSSGELTSPVSCSEADDVCGDVFVDVLVDEGVDAPDGAEELESFLIEGLAPGTTYTFWVRPVQTCTGDCVTPPPGGLLALGPIMTAP